MEEIDLQRQRKADEAARRRVLATLDRADDLDAHTRRVLGEVRRDVRENGDHDG